MRSLLARQGSRPTGGNPAGGLPATTTAVDRALEVVNSEWNPGRLSYDRWLFQLESAVELLTADGLEIEEEVVKRNKERAVLLHQARSKGDADAQLQFLQQTFSEGLQDESRQGRERLIFHRVLMERLEQ